MTKRLVLDFTYNIRTGIMRKLNVKIIKGVIRDSNETIVTALHMMLCQLRFPNRAHLLRKCSSSDEMSPYQSSS
jgi:hypothetical protein